MRPAYLHPMFPHLPHQPGYNKRLRRLADTMAWRGDAHLGAATSMHRRRVGGRLDPGRVRPVAGDRPPLRSGRLGRVRLLRLPLPVLLGTAAAPGLHPARPAGGVGADRRQGRRTPHPARHPRRRPRPARRPHPGPDPDRPTRTTTAAPSKPTLADAGITLLRPARKGEKPPGGPTLLQTPPPGHRVGQRHPQRPTRPRTPRRPHHRRRLRPRRCNASSPSPPPSGTTTNSARPIRRSLIAYDH